MHTTVAPTSVVIGVVDGQTHVVEYAVAEALRLARPLRVVHCWAMPSAGAEFYVDEGTTTLLQADAEIVLDHASRVISALSTTLEVDYAITYGSPADVLVVEARTAAALVIGSDDMPWFERFLGGELSGHLAKAADCPVIVVPQDYAPGQGDGGVVVTIDGQTSALGPLRYAFEQADIRGEALHVLHAVPAGTGEDELGSVRANLAEVVAGWQEQFPGVEVHRSTSEGRASEVCLEATRRAAILIMGRHHRGGSPLALVRPVARAVLREAHCPVAVVPLDHGVL